MASGVVDIWVSSTSFQKSNIGWPQQPPTEIVLISVKKWIFDDLFHKKGLVVVSWVLEMIKPSESVFCLMKWGCRGHWGHWGCWGYWGHWGCRGVKAWKIPTEDFRVIQESEFSFILCFEKKSFWVESLESWYIMLEAVEASRCHFFENWWMKYNFFYILKTLGTIIQ